MKIRPERSQECYSRKKTVRIRQFPYRRENLPMTFAHAVCLALSQKETIGLLQMDKSALNSGNRGLRAIRYAQLA